MPAFQPMCPRVWKDCWGKGKVTISAMCWKIMGSNPVLESVFQLNYLTVCYPLGISISLFSYLELREQKVFIYCDIYSQPKKTYYSIVTPLTISASWQTRKLPRAMLDVIFNSPDKSLLSLHYKLWFVITDTDFGSVHLTHSNLLPTMQLPNEIVVFFQLRHLDSK